MEHNFSGYTGRSNEEIVEDNKRKYLGEVRMSDNLRWHDKLSPKERRQAFFIIGYMCGCFATVIMYFIFEWIFG